MGTFPGLKNPVYITPTQVKRIIGTTASAVNDDDLLLRFCEETSRRIDKYCNRFFYPRYQELKTNWPGTSFDLRLPFDLINVVTLTNGDGNVILPTNLTTGNANYFLYEQDSYPRWKLQLSIISGIVFLFVSTPQQAISIKALWGYPASEYDGSWKTDSAATVQNGTSQNATIKTLQVQTGYFNAGDTVYIDDEFEIVQSVSVLTPSSNFDTLTVSRGSAGSTAAVHLNGTTIYLVEYHPEIFHAAERLTAWAYRLKDSQQFQDIGVSSMGVISLPKGMPVDCADILRDFVRGHRK